MGKWVLDASDFAVRAIQDAPEKPDMHMRDLPVVGSFYRGEAPPRSTRYTTELYELHEKAQEAYGSLRKKKTPEERNAWRKEHDKILKARKMLDTWARQRQLYRKRIEEIMTNPDSSGEVKRDVITELHKKRNDYDEKIYKKVYEIIDS